MRGNEVIMITEKSRINVNCRYTNICWIPFFVDVYYFPCLRGSQNYVFIEVHHLLAYWIDRS